MSLIFIVIQYALDGWMISSMWAWFVVPLGVPAITFWHAIGIDTLVGMLAVGISTKTFLEYAKAEYDTDEVNRARIVTIIYRLFVFFVAWCVK